MNEENPLKYLCAHSEERRNSVESERCSACILQDFNDEERLNDELRTKIKHMRDKTKWHFPPDVPKTQDSMLVFTEPNHNEECFFTAWFNGLWNPMGDDGIPKVIAWQEIYKPDKEDEE